MISLPEPLPFARLGADTHVRWIVDTLPNAAGVPRATYGAPRGARGETSDEVMARLRLVWELGLASGRLRAFFHDVDAVPDFPAFAAWAHDPARWFFVLYIRNAPAAFVCLEGLSATGSQRLAHFCTLPTAPRPELVALGRDFVRWLGRATPVRQLLGITPACYRHALAFAREVGFAPLATLRDAVFCRGRVRDAVLTLCDTAA